MCLLNIGVILSSILCGYIVYSIALRYGMISIEQITYDDLDFQFIDWLWLILAMIVGLIFSIFLGTKLAKKYAEPMVLLAKATQDISHGDLTARVHFSEQHPDEIIKMLRNFNQMAEKLEVAVNNSQVWNAAIAHELRTPITILQGRLQGIVDGVFTADTQLIKNLLNQVAGLSNLVEDLRTLSLFENQQLRLNIEENSFTLLLNKVLLMFQEKLNKANLQVELDINSDQVQCDPRRMQQILIAILDNATRYSNAGKLYISTTNDQQNWILKIQDQGPGISEMDSVEIFTPFFRVEKSRNKEWGGTGLGLSIVKALIVAHQGHIEYQNLEGQSLFIIQLPLHAV